MKTLSEVKKQEEADLTRWSNKRHDRRVALANVAKGVAPLFPKSAIELQDSLMSDMVDPIDIACDNCGTELVNTSPHIVLTSYPPQIKIGCPGCGWCGYKTY